MLEESNLHISQTNNSVMWYSSATNNLEKLEYAKKKHFCPLCQAWRFDFVSDLSVACSCCEQRVNFRRKVETKVSAFLRSAVQPNARLTLHSCQQFYCNRIFQCTRTFHCSSTVAFMCVIQQICTCTALLN